MSHDEMRTVGVWRWLYVEFIDRDHESGLRGWEVLLLLIAMIPVLALAKLRDAYSAFFLGRSGK